MIHIPLCQCGGETNPTAALLSSLNQDTLLRETPTSVEDDE